MRGTLLNDLVGPGFSKVAVETTKNYVREPQRTPHPQDKGVRSWVAGSAPPRPGEDTDCGREAQG